MPLIRYRAQRTARTMIHEDKAFLRRWFNDDSGNLYEEGQSDFVSGAENQFNLETNEALNALQAHVESLDIRGPGTAHHLVAKLDAGNEVRALYQVHLGQLAQQLAEREHSP